MSQFRFVATVLFSLSLIPVSLRGAQANQAAAAHLTSAGAAQAQGTGKPMTVVHADTNLVLVDVVVTEHGKPVHKLDRTRFHVLENGKEQPISGFDEHKPSPAPADLRPSRRRLRRCRRILIPTSRCIPMRAW